MTALWIARHAPATTKGICYGHHDIAVGETPENAAARLRATLPATADGKTRVWWSSPSRRCADVAAAMGDLSFRYDPRLREMHFGDWEGRAWNDIEHEPEFRVWARDWQRARVPGGESAIDLGARVQAWFAELSEGDTHFVIAHAGVIRTLQVHVGGRSWDDAMKTPVPHLEWISIS